MGPRHRGRLVPTLAFVVVLAFAGVYALGALPTVVVIVPAGTVFTTSALHSWVAHFVAPAGGRIIGAAVIELPALDAGLPGYWGLGLAPGIQFAPSIHSCPYQPDLPPASEAFNMSFLPGVYTIYWDTCITWLPTSITVTMTVLVVP